MAGLVPAIHEVGPVERSQSSEMEIFKHLPVTDAISDPSSNRCGVDGRDKPGHDA
jgi:hypothetical protein